MNARALVETIEIAGPGFINIRIKDSALTGWRCSNARFRIRAAG